MLERTVKAAFRRLKEKKKAEEKKEITREKNG